MVEGAPVLWLSMLKAIGVPRRCMTHFAAFFRVIALDVHRDEAKPPVVERRAIPSKEIQDFIFQSLDSCVSIVVILTVALGQRTPRSLEGRKSW